MVLYVVGKLSWAFGENLYFQCLSVYKLNRVYIHKSIYFYTYMYIEKYDVQYILVNKKTAYTHTCSK